MGVDANATQQITLSIKDQTSGLLVNTSVVGQNTANNTTYNGTIGGTLTDYVGAGGTMTGQIQVKAVGFQATPVPCIGFDSAIMKVTG